MASFREALVPILLPAKFFDSIVRSTTRLGDSAARALPATANAAITKNVATARIIVPSLATRSTRLITVTM